MIGLTASLVLAVGCGGELLPPEPAVQMVAPEAVVPPPPPEPVWPVVTARARVVAVGDLLMHTNVKRSAAAASVVDEAGLSVNHEGYSVLFEHVDHVIASADLAFANLETPVAPDSHRGTRSMVFNAPPALLTALVHVGFDVVSFANNHVYDQGREGLVETMARLETADLPQIGAGPTCAAARAPRVVDVEGIRVGFIGSTLVFNDNLNLGPDEPCAFDLDETQALQAAFYARHAGADIVVLSVHWGREYRTEPEPEHVELAHRLVEGGIDVVVGHHPHVVQPVEIVHTADGRQAVIAYSLGNFISNQRYDYTFGVTSADRGNPRDGLLLGLDLETVDHGPDAHGVHRIQTRIAGVQAVPVWTDNSSRRIVEPAPVIRPVILDEALDAALHAARSAPDDSALAERVALLQLRREQVAAILGDMLPARDDEPAADPDQGVEMSTGLPETSP